LPWLERCRSLTLRFESADAALGAIYRLKTELAARKDETDALAAVVDDGALSAVAFLTR
jgi:hypothetical protein